MSESKKVAMVTGAGSGIGKACAIRLAEAGMRVAVTDINVDAAEKTAQKIIEQGGEALSFQHDVGKELSSHTLVQQLLTTWGRIDVLVANAGVQIPGSLLTTQEKDWDNILTVNLKGVAYCCKAVIPCMLKQSNGSLVLISSINAVVGSAGMAVYDMSKAGVLALMRNLAVEYGGQGIRVNAVCPGNTLTEFHTDKMIAQGTTMEQIEEMTKGYGLLGRVARPMEIANAVYFLASEQASFVTGHNLIVDGGYSVSGSG